MKRAFVFIDGGNFYFKLKDLTSKLNSKYSLLDFNFRSFAEWLTKPNQLIEIRYYLGAIKRERNNSKSEQLYSSQQKLIGKIQQQNIAITLGQVIRRRTKLITKKALMFV